MADRLTLVGIAVDHRQECSPKLQAVLSDFGGEILMRAGVPLRGRGGGLIALIVEGEEGTVRELTSRLEEIKDVTVKTISF